MILNKLDTPADVFINGTIGVFPNDGETVAAKMADLMREDERESIELVINSGGGSVIDGWNIINTIRDAQAYGMKVNVTIAGLAASMASVIALFGDKVSMTDYSLLMIHNAHLGDEEVDEKQAKALEAITTSIRKIYERKTRMSKSKIKRLMEEETWFDAVSAEKLGLVDEILETETPARLAPAAALEMGVENVLNHYSSLIYKTENQNEKMQQFLNLFPEAEFKNADEVVEHVRGIVAQVNDLQDELKAAKTVAGDFLTERNAAETALKEAEERNDELQAQLDLYVAQKEQKEVELFNTYLNEQKEAKGLTDKQIESFNVLAETAEGRSTVRNIVDDMKALPKNAPMKLSEKVQAETDKVVIAPGAAIRAKLETIRKNNKRG